MKNIYNITVIEDDMYNYTYFANSVFKNNIELTLNVFISIVMNMFKRRISVI